MLLFHFELGSTDKEAIITIFFYLFDKLQCLAIKKTAIMKRKSPQINLQFTKPKQEEY